MNVTVVHVALYYEYFYQKVYGVDYQLPFDKYEDSFSEYLSTIQSKTKSNVIGFNWLWQYFVYQYSYWVYAVKPKTPNGRVIPSYIIGPKAIGRFFGRNQSMDFKTSNSELLSQYKISLKELLYDYGDIITTQKIVFNDPKRRLRLNTIEGLATCIQHTTLYDHTDSACQQCIYTQQCRVILQSTYPSLFKSRGYE